MTPQGTALLMSQEGLRTHAYKDTTGHWTIGYGRNLTADGISQAEAAFLLANDVGHIEAVLTKLGWFTALNEVRRDICVNMAYQVGMAGFFGFKKFIAALADHNYVTAAAEMRNSEAYKQTTSRWQLNAEIMELGQYPSEPAYA